MTPALLARAVAAFVLAASCLVPAVPSRAAGGDVALILRASGAAQRLDALPKIHTLRLHGAVRVAGGEGTAESWQDVRDGRYAQYIEAGPVGGAQGYDGAHAWNRDTSGVVWDDAS